MSQFNNPYSGQKDVKRITTDVSSADYYLIKSLRPSLATITATLGTLWQKLCYELRKRNITDCTHIPEFEQFVANCQLILPSDPGSGGGLSDGTACGFNPPSLAPYVGGGTPQSSPSGAPASAVLPNIQSGGGKRRKGQGGGKGTE